MLRSYGNPYNLKGKDMYQLFTKVYDSLTAVIRPPEFELIKRTYEAQLLNIINYYNNRVYAVKSNHLLCRLLTMSEIPVQYELDRYVEIAYTRSPYVAKHFNFTSELSYGKVAPSIFYGPENNEIILYNEDYFDIDVVIKNWKTVSAVKVLEHPFSDLGLLLPTGIDHSTDKGLVVMTVNIPMLLVQYRSFVLEQYNRILMPGNNEARLSVTHFVHMYVLPNILESHLELCIVNRLINLYYGAPMGEALKHHPFSLIDYSAKIDKTLLSVSKRLQRTRMLYFSMLKNIPSIDYPDAQEALLMPDIARTRQVWWAMLLTRLRIIKFLLDIGGANGIAMNRSMVNKLQIELKHLQEENMIKTLLPDDMYFDVSENINFMLSL